MRNANEANYAVSGMRSRVILTNADYAAGGISILPEQRIVETTPGAAGVLALILPKLCDVPMGAIFTVTHYGTTNNTTVDDQNDGIVALGQFVLTADKDLVSFIHSGTHWTPYHDITT